LPRSDLGLHRSAAQLFGGKFGRPVGADVAAKKYSNPRRAIALTRPPWRLDVHWLDLLGFAAAVAVLAGFCMNSIRNLRTAALASNVLFVLYGVFAHVYPVVILHLILAPINLQKLRQVKSQTYSAEPQ
jgi:hypothetical protein